MNGTAEPTDTRVRERERAAEADRAKQQRDAEAKLVRSQMRTPEGRRFVRWLLDRAGINSRLEAPNDRAMAHIVGYRNFGCDLDRDLEAHCPDLRVQMLKERYE